LRALLGRKQAGVLDDEELWQQFIDDGYGIAFPFVNEAAYAGFAAGEEMLLNIGALVDFDLVNPFILELGIDGTMELVTKVAQSTRRQLRDMMRNFYAAPDVAKNDFMAALEPLFGRTRAEMIAVTEMTNAYSAATIETARVTGAELGLTLGYEVSTVNDADVCEVFCIPASLEGPYPLTDTEHRPALHPRCRCDAVIVEMK